MYHSEINKYILQGSLKNVSSFDQNALKIWFNRNRFLLRKRNHTQLSLHLYKGLVSSTIILKATHEEKNVIAFSVFFYLHT